MAEAFRIGGWGMWPTLVFGVLWVIACARYAWKPEARNVPLLVSLGALVLFSGSLGFAMGVVHSLSGAEALAQKPNALPFGELLAIGTAESTFNIAWAMFLAVIGTLIASVGALRRSLQPA